MDITSHSREQINAGLDRARAFLKDSHPTVRILFSPRRITDKNFGEVCEIYSRLGKDDFDTVVVVESHPGSARQKLPMPSFHAVETPLGEILANDRLRNDFCDEDDDFFINDEAFDQGTCLYDQLMMLQCALGSFSVLSMQITDEGSFIVKELAYALEEILSSKNALIVFCCDMEKENYKEFEKVMSLYNADNQSGLMNYLNGGESAINGLGTFIAGLIVAQKWGLKLSFNSLENSHSTCQNLLTGFAEMQRQPIFG